MTTKRSTTHLSGANLAFIESLYEQWRRDPDSVDPSWIPLFREQLDGADRPAPRFKPRSIFSPPAGAPSLNGRAGDPGGLEESSIYINRLSGTQVHTPGRTAGFAAQVESLVRAYRLHGHAAARIDPLRSRDLVDAPELDPAQHGFSEADLETEVRLESLFGGEPASLGRVLKRLKELYCGSIAIEYQHITGVEERAWIRRAVERDGYADQGAGATIYQGLVDADAFETFLHKKYVGAKRFSLTGGDSLIPMMRAMLVEAGRLGVEEVVIGMAHRGRLNVLHNVMGKPAAAMFSEFEKTKTPEKYIGSSDVKYHMGYSSDFETEEGRSIHLSLSFNPSHLEFVDPIVCGRVRAKQTRLGSDDAARRVMPMLLHGDAAFAGQGIVAETFNMADLPGYDVGGTYHIVINNQIGFTTLPEEGRSTRYATDIAKMVEVPILHVNGDDPEACVAAALFAVRWRQRFGKDVVIDLMCYRRYGHNEGDEPRFTQPVMYSIIDGLSHVREGYGQRLVERGQIDEEEARRVWEERMDSYTPAWDEVQAEPLPKDVASGSGVWSEFRGGDVERADDPETGVERSELERIGRALSEIPEGFSAHRTIARLFKARAEMAAGDRPIDWGFAESLAMASIVAQGGRVRLSGQDSIRGTFSHRHAAITDVESGERHWPARQVRDGAKFEVINSTLSEAAVLGFEYGFSLDSPDALVGWEAQFGDFVNGAQVVIDQFISSGEDKWNRLSGLIMLLPHGYEGQGPEHSSARLERFLQMCAEDNMFVVNLTTPANYFHALRRQVQHAARKPLVVMTPKSLLRLREAVSELDELSEGRFQHIIDDPRELERSEVRRVLLCSGKVYYDLAAHAEANKIEDAAVLRVEQLYPLSTETLSECVGAYAEDAQIVWVQEEPENMGAWRYMFPQLLELFADRPPRYAGRVASASPATGDPEAHQLEQRALIRDAFEGVSDQTKE